MLHGPKDDLRLGRVPRDVEARLEAEPRAHGRKVGVAVGPPPRDGRATDSSCRWSRRHADGVGDLARLDLVVAQQAGQDRETGGVGRRPPRGTQGVGAQVPDRPGPAVEPPGAVLGVVELVERARRGVDHDGVAVSGGVLPSLDRGVGAEGIRSRVALAGVLERDVHKRLSRGDNGVGNAVGVRRIARRPEVGMQERRRGVHAGEPLGAVHIDGQRRDVGVPDVVGREHRASGTGNRGPGSGGSGTKRHDHGSDRRHGEDEDSQREHRCPPAGAAPLPPHAAFIGTSVAGIHTTLGRGPVHRPPRPPARHSGQPATVRVTRAEVSSEKVGRPPSSPSSPGDEVLAPSCRQPGEGMGRKLAGSSRRTCQQLPH